MGQIICYRGVACTRETGVAGPVAESSEPSFVSLDTTAFCFFVRSLLEP